MISTSIYSISSLFTWWYYFSS